MVGVEMKRIGDTVYYHPTEQERELHESRMLGRVDEPRAAKVLAAYYDGRLLLHVFAATMSTTNDYRVEAALGNGPGCWSHR